MYVVDCFSSLPPLFHHAYRLLFNDSAHFLTFLDERFKIGYLYYIHLINQFIVSSCALNPHRYNISITNAYTFASTVSVVKQVV